jgi:hypothetical protein
MDIQLGEQLVARPSSRDPLQSHLARCFSGLRFAEVSARNLDVGIVGQLPAADLPLGDEFEASSLQIIGFEAPFRRRRFVEQALKDTPGNPHDALILADPDAKLDGRSVRIPAGIRREAKEH